MPSRHKRLQILEGLIRAGRPGTQDELIQMLEQKKIKITQATLSRDLKFLRVSKQYDAQGRGYYNLPVVPVISDTEEALSGFPESGFVSLAFSQKLGLIKTLPGYAAGLASRIDRANRPEILGTVAGDDTILLVPREGKAPHEIKKALRQIFPGLRSRII